MSEKRCLTRIGRSGGYLSSWSAPLSQTQMRQTTTAEVRLDEGNAASFGPARRATRRFDRQRPGCEGISLRGTPMRPKIEPNRLGIRGMSVNACRTRRVHQWVVALIRKGRV